MADADSDRIVIPQVAAQAIAEHHAAVEQARLEQLAQIAGMLAHTISGLGFPHVDVIDVDHDRGPGGKPVGLVWASDAPDTTGLLFVTTTLAGGRAPVRYLVVLVDGVWTIDTQNIGSLAALGERLAALDLATVSCPPERRPSGLAEVTGEL